MLNKTKNKVAELIKTHVSYLSIIIIIIGLSLKYSLPSFFPILLKFDIEYFGSIFIEFGFILFIGNWLIDKYKEEVNRKLFSNIIDQKIGLKGTSLLTELVNLIHPFSYNSELYSIESHIKKNETKKYDIIQKMTTKIRPKQDNVYYSFGHNSTGEDSPRILKIIFNSKNLILSKDIRKKEAKSYIGAGTTYEIVKPLKKGKLYTIEITTLYPCCMSDLGDGIEYDFHEYKYYAFTEKTKIRNKYDFDNFKEYEFKAEKTFLNIPDVIEIPCKVDLKTKEVIIESGNLKNGDNILITYMKKPNPEKDIKKREKKRR